MFYEWFGCTRRWREGGGRRGDASGLTLCWIGSVAASAVAVGDIGYLKSITIPTKIHLSNFQVA